MIRHPLARPTTTFPVTTTAVFWPCPRCGGTGRQLWYNASTGRDEDWPCVLCRPDEFDAKEAAEGLNPNTHEDTPHGQG